MVSGIGRNCRLCSDKGLGVRGFKTAENGNHVGATNTWFTPRDIIRSLGVFDLDPCTQSFRPFDTAKQHICEDMGGDGLANPWQGRVWLNPPYGKYTHRWLNKLHAHGNGIALVFSRTDTRWSQEHMAISDATLFVKGRICFIKENGIAAGTASNGTMLLAYGKDNIESLHNIEGVVMVNKNPQVAEPGGFCLNDARPPI